MLSVGDVILTFDDTTNPPKTKRLLLVAADGWFLRINSRPHFPPQIAMLLSENPGCLDHDSFLECRGILDLDMSVVVDWLLHGQARVLGKIGRPFLNRLLTEISMVRTLNAGEKATIVAALRAAFVA